MKKLISGMMLAAFLMFGVANIQTVVAAQQGIEIVNLDKDPDKDKDKKDKKSKDAKTADKKTANAPAMKKDCAVKTECKEAKTSCCSKGHPDKR